MLSAQFGALQSGVRPFLWDFFAGEGNFLKEVFLPPHPHPSRTFKRKCYFGLHSAFKRIKLNFILFREDNILPYGKDVFSIVGEAISLPFLWFRSFICHPERSAAESKFA